MSASLHTLFRDTLDSIEQQPLVLHRAAIKAAPRRFTGEPPSAFGAFGDRDDLAATCYARLRDELLDAIATDPQTVVQTPGYGIKYTAADVVADDLSGSDAALDNLLRLVADAAKGDDVRLRATAWLSDRAHAHARFHVADMVDELEGDA